MLGIVSDVLVMFVVSMICCLECFWKMCCCLFEVSCVYSGSSLMFGCSCLCSVLVVLWILCLFDRKMSMLLGFLCSSLLMVFEIRFVWLLFLVVFLW